MDLPVNLDLLFNLPQIIYVSDLKSNELLFFSKYAQETLCIERGQVCYQGIYGRSERCFFCSSSQLVDDEGKPIGVIISEIYHARLNRWFEARSQACNWQGRLVRLDLAVDITDRIQLEDTITQKDEYFAAVFEERFQGLFKHALNAIALHEIIFDQKGSPIDYRFLAVNPAFEKMAGLPSGEILEKTLSQVLPGIERDWIEVYDKVAASGKPVEFEENNGDLEKYYLVRAYIPEPGQFVTIFQAVTESRKLEDRLSKLAFRDSLTGLYNRRYFEQELERFGAVEAFLPLSLIIGDVNGLKIINDSLGHQTGDLVLKSVAWALAEMSRPEDLVARWSGDEFVMLLPNTTTEKVQKVCSAIERAGLPMLDMGLKPSIGLGYATKSSLNQSNADLIKTAENRMYRHKMNNAQSIRSALVISLQRTLAEKSYETEEHARHMQKLSLDLAKRLELTESQLNTLSLVALLHDIGKVSIPESILNKAGPLNANEWEVMKQHCESGYRILVSSPELIEVAEGVLAHHERWDGTGYPRGLKGTDIPVLARIVSLADAYDAMISDRPYRLRITPNQALEEIRRCSGTQFDPNLAKEFITMMEELNKNSP